MKVSESSNAHHVLFHVGVEDALPHTLVGDDRGVEECVAGPMVAVGLGVDDVAKFAPVLQLCFELQGVAGFVRTVNHHDAVGSCDEAVIATSNLVFHKHVGCNLFHGVPPNLVGRCAIDLWELNPGESS